MRTSTVLASRTKGSTARLLVSRGCAVAPSESARLTECEAELILPVLEVGVLGWRSAASGFSMISASSVATVFCLLAASEGVPGAVLEADLTCVGVRGVVELS